MTGTEDMSLAASFWIYWRGESLVSGNQLVVNYSNEDENELGKQVVFFCCFHSNKRMDYGDVSDV